MRSTRRSPRRAATRLVVLVAACSCFSAAAAPAPGLEIAPTYDNGPRTPFGPYGGVEQQSSTTPEMPATPSDGGLYVIGDSISWGVPYIQRAAADGARAQVRSWAGWTVMLHRLVTTWNDSPVASFSDAAAGTWGAVFVELGTNDVACLHGGNGCWENPSDDPERLAVEEAKIADQVDAAAATLLDAGKCVVWAGPRAGTGANQADVETFNARLRALERDHASRFNYVDYDAYTQTDDALRADFARPGSDGVHPQTAAARAAIAELAVTSAEQRCGLAADPPIAPPSSSVPAARAPAPQPAPAAAPAPEPEPPPAPGPAEVPVVPPHPSPSANPCPAAATRATHSSCLRARAAARCAASADARARTNCMLRVRRLYGPSRQEQTAARACARSARTRAAACRAAVHRRYRAR